jgi:valyl-tRNA synthetase
MAGMEYRNEKPFSDVYFTGMVRDKQGRKMSKSLGNSPDLLDLIDRFGADAVRFGIMISSPAGNDLLFDDSSCEQGRNFNNKLWNALKLVKMWEGRQSTDHSPQTTENKFAVDWFEGQLKYAKGFIEGDYKKFRLSEVLKTIYSLIWDDFCSWYLEWIKPEFGKSIDTYTLSRTIAFFEELMQLLHPFMPFITEEIYHQLLERTNNDDLCIKQISSIDKINAELFEQGSHLKKIITAIRDTRNKNQIKPKESIKLYVQTDEDSSYEYFKNVLLKQVNANDLKYTREPIPNSIVLVVDKVTRADKFFIVTEKELDTSAQKEQLLKDLEYQKGFLASVEKKLSNERFVQNAKPDVVEVERKKKADAEAKIKAIEESLANL